MILLIDNYDSFTYNLVRYLEILNKKVVVYQNDQLTIDKIKEINPEMIVLSPGPGHPRDSGICIDVVQKLKGIYPIFGVCLGMQIIGAAFKVATVKAQIPMHGKITKIKHNNDLLFLNINQEFNVCRYHSLVLDNLDIEDSELLVTSVTSKNEIMSVRHKYHNISGVQFHPEALLTEHGLEILENFIRSTFDYK